MIIRSASFTELSDDGEIDLRIHHHVDGPGTINAWTICFDSCNGRHSTSVYLSVDGAKKLRDAINEVLGEQQ